METNTGAKVIADAITGIDFRTVVVNGKGYMVKPPTIHRLSGAIGCLAGVVNADTLRDVILTLGESRKYAEALSWLIAGDTSLADELARASYEEVVNGIELCLSMISMEVFLRAVSLAKSVSLLAARPK